MYIFNQNQKLYQMQSSTYSYCVLVIWHLFGVITAKKNFLQFWDNRILIFWPRFGAILKKQDHSNIFFGNILKYISTKAWDNYYSYLHRKFSSLSFLYSSFNCLLKSFDPISWWHYRKYGLVISPNELFLRKMNENEP